MANLEAKYRGKVFIFHSPFEYTPGWKDGDVGLIVQRWPFDKTLCREDSPRDMWLGYNIETGEFHEMWGLECFDDKKRPIIREHRALNWRP